jgi:acetoin utilization deacetylase AcuC-like enzyme
MNNISRRTFVRASSLITTGLISKNRFTVKKGYGESNKKKHTGILFDERYLKHTLGPNHPESAERLNAIQREIKKTGLDKLTKSIKPSKIDPMPYIKKIHSKKHIELITQNANDESICRLAVAGALSAVDEVCTNKLDNVFCSIRPPGHHAANNGIFGFCFYNNIAIAARYAQEKYKHKKILIIDWDYHHGDGTEWAFYDDPSVLFFSTHALHAFPGSGSASKTGRDKGKGFNINVPLPHRAGDKDIINAFNEKLLPAANTFKPDMIFISAGFDSRKDDLLGDFTITDEGFEKLTKIVMSIAKQHCQSRIVSLLEGGYNTKGLALGVCSHIKTLLNT